MNLSKYREIFKPYVRGGEDFRVGVILSRGLYDELARLAAAFAHNDLYDWAEVSDGVYGFPGSTSLHLETLDDETICLFLDNKAHTNEASLRSFGYILHHLSPIVSLGYDLDCGPVLSEDRDQLYMFAMDKLGPLSLDAAFAPKVWKWLRAGLVSGGIPESFQSDYLQVLGCIQPDCHFVSVIELRNRIQGRIKITVGTKDCALIGREINEFDYHLRAHDFQTGAHVLAGLYAVTSLAALAEQALETSS